MSLFYFALIFLLCIAVSLISIRIYETLSVKECISNARMVGKVVIVTGANTGIGFETARELAKRGARVILACRNEEKAIAACRKITADTGNTSVVYRHLNLSSLTSVRRFASNIIETEESLHVLINNAGVSGLNDRYTEDDIVEVMQINYFAPFLLTLLLLPLLKKSKPSRIINVSSILHYLGTIDFDNINVNNAYNEGLTYSNSKLCNVVFTVELARRLAGSGVVVNAVHPGVIATDITKEISFIFSTFFAFCCLVSGRSVNQGAQTVLHLAVSEECENVSGEYFVDCAKRFKSWKALNKNTANKLWDFSESLVGYESAKTY